MPSLLHPTFVNAVVFDHDGTLVDSESVHCACWNQVLSRYSATLSYKDYCQNYNGLPTLETATRIQQQFNLPCNNPQVLYALKVDALAEHLAQQPFPLLPGVADTLSKLAARNTPLAIASGANPEEVMHSVKSHKLESLFSAITTKKDVINSKPAPDVYLLAAKKLGVAPKHCIAVEDSDTGEASALGAGMLCIRLTPHPITPWQCRNMNEAYTLIDQLLISEANI